MSSKEEINSLICNLSYDPYEVLPIDKRPLSCIAVPNDCLHIAYPGALMTGRPDHPRLLAADRAPMKIFMDFPGMTTCKSIIVDNPVYSNVKAGMDALLEKWYAQCGGGFEIPCHFQTTCAALKNKAQLINTFGCDADFLTGQMKLCFETPPEKAKPACLIQYRQIFYTVSVQAPARPCDVFGDSVTRNQLESLKISGSIPPLYVQSVQYGRQVYLKFESPAGGPELLSVINSTLILEGEIKIRDGAEEAFQSKCREISCFLITQGGSYTLFSGLLTAKGFLEELNTIVFESTKLSMEIPAHPICYVPVFLKDNLSILS